MIAAINEFERTNLLERQKEGIAIAKRNGVYSGRKPFKSNKLGMYLRSVPESRKTYASPNHGSPMWENGDFFQRY